MPAQPGVELVPQAGRFPFNDGSHYPGVVLTVQCVDPSEEPVAGDSTTSTCQETGTWTDLLASTTCQHVCHRLEQLHIAGEMESSVWVYTDEGEGAHAVDTVASKSCAVGYAVEGQENATEIALTCTLVGWTPEAPCCLPIAAGRECPCPSYVACRIRLWHHRSLIWSRAHLR